MVGVVDKALELLELEEESGGSRSASEIVILPSCSSPISDRSRALARMIVLS